MKVHITPLRILSLFLYVLVFVSGMLVSVHTVTAQSCPVSQEEKWDSTGIPPQVCGTGCSDTWVQTPNIASFLPSQSNGVYVVGEECRYCNVQNQQAQYCDAVDSGIRRPAGQCHPIAVTCRPRTLSSCQTDSDCDQTTGQCALACLPYVVNGVYVGKACQQADPSCVVPSSNSGGGGNAGNNLCGNNICDPTENIISCPQDCSPTDIFTIDMPPPIRSVSPGDTTTFTVNILNTYSGIMNLSVDCPPGASCRFAQGNSIVFTDLADDNQTSQTLLVTAGSIATDAWYKVTVTGVINGETRSAYQWIHLIPTTNDAECVGVSAPATVTAGQAFNASITMKNTGTKTWDSIDAGASDGPHSLDSYNPADNTTWGAASARIPLPSSPIAPGSTAVFALNNFVAPLSPGVYPFDFRMVEGGVGTFGSVCSKAGGITVLPGAAPTVTINASPTAGPSPVTSTLSWTTTGNPSTCNASGGWSGSKNTAGGSEAETNITNPTTYTLTCTNAAGTNQASAVVTPTASLVPTITFQANPPSGSSPLDSTLTWSTGNNPTFCNASGGWSGSKNTAGGSEAETNITNPTTYTLTCTNAAGTNSRSVTITPSAASACVPPPAGQGPYAPNQVLVGSSFDLGCDYGGDNDYIPPPTGCSWPGNNGGHIGSEVTFTCIAPLTPQNVTYTCAPTSRPGFTPFCSVPVPISKTVAVISGVSSPGITITASPIGGPAPLDSTISWTTSNNPTSCIASGGWSGSKNTAGGSETFIGLTTPTVYTLTCTNSAGTISKSRIVTPITQYNINVTKTYGGSVKSTGGIISCNPTCSALYPQGSTVTLVPYPDSLQWKFIGWTGACSGLGNALNECVISVDGPKNVKALFAPKSLNYQEF